MRDHSQPEVVIRFAWLVEMDVFKASINRMGKGDDAIQPCAL